MCVIVCVSPNTQNPSTRNAYPTRTVFLSLASFLAPRMSTPHPCFVSLPVIQRYPNLDALESPT